MIVRGGGGWGQGVVDSLGRNMNGPVEVEDRGVLIRTTEKEGMKRDTINKGNGPSEKRKKHRIFE